MYTYCLLYTLQLAPTLPPVFAGRQPPPGPGRTATPPAPPVNDEIHEVADWNFVNSLAARTVKSQWMSIGFNGLVDAFSRNFYADRVYLVVFLHWCWKSNPTQSNYHHRRRRRRHHHHHYHHEFVVRLLHKLENRRSKNVTNERGLDS